MSLGRTIARWITDHGYESASQTLNDAVAQKKVTMSDVSLRDLAHGMLGENWSDKVKTLINSPVNPADVVRFRAMESADAIDPTAFAAITGNLLIDTVRDKYKSPEFLGDKLARHIPVTNGNLDTQKEPYLSNVNSTAANVTDIDGSLEDEDVLSPADPYKGADFSPNYVLLARPRKRGRRVDVTWEMIYADRTRQAQESAMSVGRRLGLNKEYRILKVVAGITVNYKFSFGGSAELTSPTYVTADNSTNSAYPRWINQAQSLPITNWSDINAVEQLFNQMRDPVTGEPIDIETKQWLTMPPKVHQAQHILHATQIRMMSDSTLVNAQYSSTDIKPYELMSSKYMFKMLSTSGQLFPKQDWVDDTNTATVTAAQAADFNFFGDFTRAFYYREVYPLQVVQAPPLNPDDFGRDIVLSVKASEFGVAGVSDPRYVVRTVGHAIDAETD